MPVKVKLFATLREGRGKEIQVDPDEFINPAIIIDNLGIRKKDIAILLINGKDGMMDQKLKDGDTVSIFPPVGGG